MDVAGPLGEVLAEHAEAAADLEHDVVVLEFRSAADHVEDVRVDEEVLAQLAVRPDAELAHAPDARLCHQCEEPLAVGLDRRVQLGVGQPAALGDEARGVGDVGGPVALLAHDLRRQVRGVGLDEQAVERGAFGRFGEVLRLGVGDVAGERDPPAVLEALLEAGGHREAVQDHLEALGLLGEPLDRVVLGRAGVDDQRLAGLVRELDLRGERSLLVRAGRVVAEVVEAGLADRQAFRVLRELLELLRDRVRVAGRLVRVVADRRVDLVVGVRGVQRLAA